MKASAVLVGCGALVRACIESYLKASNNCTFRQVIWKNPPLSFHR